MVGKGGKGLISLNKRKMRARFSRPERKKKKERGGAIRLSSLNHKEKIYPRRESILPERVMGNDMLASFKTKRKEGGGKSDLHHSEDRSEEEKEEKKDVLPALPAEPQESKKKRKATPPTPQRVEKRRGGDREPFDAAPPVEGKRKNAFYYRPPKKKRYALACRGKRKEREKGEGEEKPQQCPGRQARKEGKTFF